MTGIGRLSIVFDTLECATNLIYELLEHLASGLLVKLEPSCDNVEFRDEAEDGIDVEIVEGGERVDFLPYEVVNTSFPGKNVSEIQDSLKL